MALIVEYHVVADMYPVSDSVISAGMLVSLNANGQVIPTVAAADTGFGIAGDSALDAEGQTTAYSASVVIGANGAGTRFTSNRVSDFMMRLQLHRRLPFITVVENSGLAKTCLMTQVQSL